VQRGQQDVEIIAGLPLLRDGRFQRADGLVGLLVVFQDDGGVDPGIDVELRIGRDHPVGIQRLAVPLSRLEGGGQQEPDFQVFRVRLQEFLEQFDGPFLPVRVEVHQTHRHQQFLVGGLTVQNGLQFAVRLVIPIFLQEDVEQADPGLDRHGIGVDEVPVQVDRKVVLVLFPVQEPQVDGSRFKGRPVFQRFFQRLFRLVRPVRFGENPGQVVMAHRVFGNERDHLPEHLQRLLVVFPVRVERAEVDMRGDVFGIERDDLPVFRDGLWVILQVEVRAGEQEMKLRVAGEVAQRAFQDFGGLRRFAPFAIQKGQLAGQ